MTEELVVSTPEEYVRLTTEKVRVTSGAVFHIRAMGAEAMVYLLGIMPETGLEGRAELIEFCKAHFVGLVKSVIRPSIIAPQVEHLAFLDVCDLLVELMSLSGFEVEEAESFRDKGSSVDA